MTTRGVDPSRIERPAKPGHVEETVRSIDELRAEHQRQSTRLQRSVDGLMALVGRPAFAVAITVLFVGWVGANLIAPSLGYQPPDPPPFIWMQGFATLASLYLVVLVLASQRREDELERRRE